ncbi:MAG: hypothetical protein V3T46_03920 [Alphaproteobacteria bacterium]
MTKTVHWAAVTAALLGASCAGPPAETGSGAPKPATASLQETEALATAKAKTTEPRDRPGAGAASRAPAETAVAPAPPPPRITSAALMGLADNALARLLGAPGFKRIDDPAALWQYRGPRCILDVFLYADGPVYRVAHLEFRRAGTGGGPMEGRDAEKCFSGLLPGAKGKG